MPINDLPERSIHPSNSKAQVLAEAAILDTLGKALGVALEQGAIIAIGDAEVHPDGVDANRSIFVEVFAHIGKLRGGQRHKVSTDALKLLAISDFHPEARLILAFADDAAAASVTGWKAEILTTNGIEIQTVNIGDAERAEIKAAQVRQRMGEPRLSGRNHPGGLTLKIT